LKEVERNLESIWKGDVPKDLQTKAGTSAPNEAGTLAGEGSEEETFADTDKTLLDEHGESHAANETRVIDSEAGTLDREESLLTKEATRQKISLMQRKGKPRRWFIHISVSVYCGVMTESSTYEQQLSLSLATKELLLTTLMPLSRGAFLFSPITALPVIWNERERERERERVSDDGAAPLALADGRLDLPPAPLFWSLCLLFSRTEYPPLSRRLGFPPLRSKNLRSGVNLFGHESIDFYQISPVFIPLLLFS
jgi:hypothetical protein